MDAYPLLDFLVRHGRNVALALAALTFLVGVAAALDLREWPWALVGAAAGVLVFGGVASYAELIRLVTDMLMPK